MTHIGFPHSDIHGSKLSSSSPWLFAGKHVLHRLLVPRHPSYALSSLTFLLSLRRRPIRAFFGGSFGCRSDSRLLRTSEIAERSWSFTIVRCLVRFRDFIRHLGVSQIEFSDAFGFLFFSSFIRRRHRFCWFQWRISGSNR